jgi:hypothetical protein
VNQEFFQFPVHQEFTKALTTADLKGAIQLNIEYINLKKMKHNQYNYFGSVIVSLPKPHLIPNNAINLLGKLKFLPNAPLI